MVTTLRCENALLLVVDIQERLLPHIHEREEMLRRAVVLIGAAKILGIPIVWAEQYRKGLGQTDPAIVTAIGGAATPIEKITFGCLADFNLKQAIEATGRKQIILCGIETHVCILQTALAALEGGFEVFIAEDATSSRRASDRDSALRRLAQAGAIPATVEMLIMEALVEARGEKFKAILPLVK